MIKVPIEIRRAITSCAKHYAKATQKGNIVREWLFENNGYHDGNIDQLIDCCESGSNEPDAFIGYLESQATFDGNDNIY